MKQYLSNFFGVIKDGIAKGFKHRKWALIGWISTWIVPLAAIMTYMGLEASKKPKITFQPWVLIVFVILIIIYYKKARGVICDKFLASKLKGVPANPLWYLINGAVSVVTLAIIYWLVDIMSQFSLPNLLSYLTVCMGSIGLGAFCYAIDSMNVLIRQRRKGKELK